MESSYRIERLALFPVIEIRTFYSRFLFRAMINQFHVKAQDAQDSPKWTFWPISESTRKFMLALIWTIIESVKSAAIISYIAGNNLLIDFTSVGTIYPDNNHFVAKFFWVPLMNLYLLIVMITLTAFRFPWFCRFELKT